MIAKYKNQLLAGAWVGAVLVAAAAAGTHSGLVWATLSVVALAPAGVLLHFTKEPPETITQSIYQARR